MFYTSGWDKAYPRTQPGRASGWNVPSRTRRFHLRNEEINLSGSGGVKASGVQLVIVDESPEGDKRKGC